MNKVFTFMRESAVARFLIPAGIMLVIVGIIIFSINKKNQDYIEVNAVVSKTELVEDTHLDEEGNTVEATYNVYVKYTVKEVEYETLLGELSGYKEGDKLKIYYNPSDPNQITQTKSLVLPVIIILAGVASLVGGIFSAVNAAHKHAQMKEQEKGWAK